MKTKTLKLKGCILQSDNTPYIFDYENESFSWGGSTKKEYQQGAKAINAINYTGKGWNIYAWFDVSCYEYWMKKQQEQNYIQVTIRIDTENILQSDVDKIMDALDSALADADAIAYKYSFDPSTE
jgi:hypothetical protein